MMARTIKPTPAGSIKVSPSRSPVRLEPEQWVPSSFHVICGRGSSRLHHKGNRTYESLIEASVPTYKEATTKLEKSIAVDAIFEEIRKRGGGFVVLDKASRQWMWLSDRRARQKIGASLRRKLERRTADEETTSQRDVHSMHEFLVKQSSLRQSQVEIFEKLKREFA